VNRRARSGRGKDEGSAAVEAALVLPILLMFVIGSVEFGRALWTYHTMLLAVEEAGRYAMVYGESPSLLTSASCPGVTGTITSSRLADCAVAKANAYLADYGGTGVSVSSSPDSSTPPNLTISATYPFNFITPVLLPFGPFTLSSQVTVPTI
jgi:Flp pilus assembly protein TadG